MSRPSDASLHWLVACGDYFRVGALGLALTGIGLSLAAPIHGAFTLGDVASPHTPLHVRHNAELRSRVAGRVTASGVYLTLLGLGAFAGESAWRHVTRSGLGKPRRSILDSH